MLALTYYKQSANMSKYSGNTFFDYSTKTASNQDTAKEHGGYSRRRTGPEISVCLCVCVCVRVWWGRKETLHKHSLMWECAPLRRPLLYVNLHYVFKICLPSIQTCKISNSQEKAHETRSLARTHTHTHTIRCKMTWPPANLSTLQRNHTDQALHFSQIQFRLLAFMIAGFLLTYVAQ